MTIFSNFEDISNHRYNKWTVISLLDRYAKNCYGMPSQQYWLCRCDCGVIQEVVKFPLIKGTSKQCLKCAHLQSSAKNRKYVDLTGLRFGEWIVKQATEEYYKNLNPDATPDQVSQFVRLNTAEYGGLGQGNTFAQGGIARLKYAGAGMVSPRSSPNPMAERNDLAIQLFGRPLHQLTPTELEQLENFIREKFGKTTTEEETTFAARGGSMVPPARQIEGGIIELDARKTGGYIPYGKKERVDDVPAMLAKDEFVFTSRAVKAAGGGSARRGAAKMYALMKQLESKGARA